MYRIIRDLIPLSIRIRIKRPIFRLVMMIARLSVARGDAILSSRILHWMWWGWGNHAYTTRINFNQELMRLVAQTDGPILECGSGLTTILLGLLTKRRGIEVWSLEHLPEYFEDTQKMVRRYGYKQVHLNHTPLKDYGAYSWYTAPKEHMPRDFQLVICDGPSGNTPGGAYGLLPVMGDHMAHDCTILLDDAARTTEVKALNRWQQENEAGVILRKLDQLNDSFVIVTIP